MCRGQGLGMALLCVSQVVVTSVKGELTFVCCVLQGIQDMLLQYLQLVMGFGTSDQAVLITIIGAGNFIVQVRTDCTIVASVHARCCRCISNSTFCA